MDPAIRSIAPQSIVPGTQTDLVVTVKEEHALEHLPKSDVVKKTTFFTKMEDIGSQILMYTIDLIVVVATELFSTIKVFCQTFYRAFFGYPSPTPDVYQPERPQKDFFGNVIPPPAPPTPKEALETTSKLLDKANTEHDFKKLMSAEAKFVTDTLQREGLSQIQKLQLIFDQFLSNTDACFKVRNCLFTFGSSLNSLNTEKLEGEEVKTQKQALLKRIQQIKASIHINRIEAIRKQVSEYLKIDGDNFFKKLAEEQKLLQKQLESDKDEKIQYSARSDFKKYRLLTLFFRIPFKENKDHDALITRFDDIKKKYAKTFNQRGLPNLGNTCHINGTLQALTVYENEIMNGEPVFDPKELIEHYESKVLIHAALKNFLLSRYCSDEVLRGSLEELLAVLKKAPMIPEDVRKNLGQGQEDARVLLNAALIAFGGIRRLTRSRDEVSKKDFELNNSVQSTLLIHGLPFVERIENVAGLIKDSLEEYRPDFSSRAGISSLEDTEEPPETLVVDFDRKSTHEQTEQQQAALKEKDGKERLAFLQSLKNLREKLEAETKHKLNDEALRDMTVAALNVVHKDRPVPGDKNRVKLNVVTELDLSRIIGAPMASSAAESKREKVDARYEFSAAICHQGNGFEGHWVAYVRKGDETYYYSDRAAKQIRFDQSTIDQIEATASIVLFRRMHHRQVAAPPEEVARIPARAAAAGAAPARQTPAEPAAPRYSGGPVLSTTPIVASN